MLGIKFDKPLTDFDSYSACAKWCMNNNATIEDKGEYYECVAIPSPSFDELKQQKINEFKFIRDKEELAPINNFDADEKSIMRMNNAIIVLDATKETIIWTLADNSTIEVSADDLRNIIILIGERSSELHEKYRILKEKVEACSSEEELAAVKWEE